MENRKYEDLNQTEKMLRALVYSMEHHNCDTAKQFNLSQAKQFMQENGIPLVPLKTDICDTGKSEDSKSEDTKPWRQITTVTQTTIKSHIENIKTLTNELCVIDNRFVNSNAEKIHQKLDKLDTLLSDCLFISKV